ncbi:MAG TPA: hypothetical protein VG408_05820 [Actinomycetota bacterium]|nr:hypothetical protein [Actinomycetota bacterium]
MKFAVESWAPDYGAPIGLDELDPTSVQVDLSIEMPVARWAPIAPSTTTVVPDKILFTDGIRRVDARVWVHGESGAAHPGLCASYAAGAVVCDGRARVVAAEVERGLFTLARDAEAITCKHAIYPVRRPETKLYKTSF